METALGFLLFSPLFAMAVVLHEVSHGWAALQFGDRTALQAGRLTLNPLKHLDWFGTVVLPLFLLLMKAPFILGWAKPVPIDPSHLRRPRRDMLWIGAAGPVANFLLAMGAVGLLRFLGSSLPLLAVALIKYFALANLVLGVFNLFPIPPLDGSRVLAGLLPSRWAAGMLILERWGVILLLILLYFGVVDYLLWPTVQWLLQLLGLSS